MADTILTIKKRIEAIGTEDSGDTKMLVQLLSTLSKEEMTQDLLKSTKIGLCVNTLRKKSTCTEVQAACKVLVQKWVALAEKPASSPAAAATPSLALRPSLSSSLSSSSSLPSTPLPLREAILKILFSAMQVEGNHAGVSSAAKELEVALYRKHLGTADPDDVEKMPTLASNLREYKAHARSAAAALRNPDNALYRTQLLTGEMEAAVFADMKGEDFLSEEEKKKRKEELERIRADKQLAKSGGTKSTSLQCGKCKGKDALYSQRQTRSADEPMTTFVVCNLCGHRWNFC